MAYAKLSMGIRPVREWMCERSTSRGEREEVVFSSGNGYEPRLGQLQLGYV